MAVISRVALKSAHAVRVVTRGTGRATAHHVFTVQREALIRQDALAIVTPVAQCVRTIAFSRIIGRVVILDKERFVNRTVRTTGTAKASIRRAVRVVTVRATKHRTDSPRTSQADNLIVVPWAYYRMKRGVGGLELEQGILLRDLP